MNRKGFTLIEVLVVVSIIALLSSIVITSTNVARAKARDTKKIAESNSVKTAIASYTIDRNRAPDNYVCTGSCQKVGGNVAQRSTLEVEDTGNPLDPQTESGKAYRATMNDLVTGGYLASVPQSSGGAAYVYYDYGPGSAAGGLFGTVLDTAQATTNGIGGSCRPNTSSAGGGSQQTVVLGDINGDGVPDYTNYLAIKANFGRTDCTAGNSYCNGADLNKDGSVTSADLGLWGTTVTVGLNSGNLCDQNSTTDYCICNPY